MSVDAADSKFARTALHWATLQGRIEIMEYLLKKNAHVDLPDGNELTPLMIAALHPHDNVAATLLGTVRGCLPCVSLFARLSPAAV